MIYKNIFLPKKRISKTRWIYNDLGPARVHTGFMEAYDAIRTRGLSYKFSLKFYPFGKFTKINP